VDPICHTLFGATLASTGLERKTRFGRATLILGANLPDIDAITYGCAGTIALEVRRGITHGIPALLIFPALLAGAMLWLSRAKSRKAGAPAADFKWLLVLSAISVVSHPVLDFLNVYGVRWLMPFDATWFYGDILYIVDPWMWAILAGTLLLAWRNRRHPSAAISMNPALVGILLAFVYISAMAGGAWMSRQAVVTQFPAAKNSRLMVAPVPIDPFSRTVVIDLQSAYRTGIVTLLPEPRFHLDPRLIPKGNHPAFGHAAATTSGRHFLNWARFPFFELDESTNPPTVYILDARYTLARNTGFGAVQIPLPRSGRKPNKFEESRLRN
jgi:inner membrane protein